MMSKIATYEEGESKTDKIMQECFHAFLDQLMRQGQGLQAQQKVKAVRRLLCKPLWKDDFRREMDRKISEIAMEGVTSVIAELQGQLMQANSRNLGDHQGTTSSSSSNTNSNGGAEENKQPRKLREKKDKAQLLKTKKESANKNQGNGSSSTGAGA